MYGPNSLRPVKGTIMADNENNQTNMTNQDARFIDPNTGAPSAKASGSSLTGRGAETEKGQSPKDESGKPAAQNVNMGDRNAQGNLGGRNPGDTKKNSGDQDSTQARADMDMIDPMKGRLPDQLDKIKNHEQAKGIAQRDP